LETDKLRKAIDSSTEQTNKQKGLSRKEITNNNNKEGMAKVDRKRTNYAKQLFHQPNKQINKTD